MAKLKVFRTAIGFYDAYVAAPSRVAALCAWGADTDLFSNGLAEVVIDNKLTAAPLETPGEVVKVSRGSAIEHLDELERSSLKKASRKPVAVSTKAAIARPSRRKLDEAETALGEADEAHHKALDQIDRRIAKLRAQRVAIGDKFKPERETLERCVADTQQVYEAAVEKWRNAD